MYFFTFWEKGKENVLSYSVTEFTFRDNSYRDFYILFPFLYILINIGSLESLVTSVENYYTL